MYQMGPELTCVSYCRIRSNNSESPCVAVTPWEPWLHRWLRDARHRIKILNWTKITVWPRTAGTDNPDKHEEYSQRMKGINSFK